jgi:uncharacterized protein (TIGR02996 family)
LSVENALLSSVSEAKLMGRPHHEVPVDDRSALLANVLDSPGDNTARLVLADWLEEHDEESFGRFLRAGVIASRFRRVELITEPEYYDAIRTLSDIATTGEPASWLATLGIGLSPLTRKDWVWNCESDRVTVRLGPAAGTFTRGLLAELEVTLGEWYTLCASALAIWPIERVRIADVPGLSFQIEHLTTKWRLTGQVRLPRRNVPLIRHAVPTAIAPGAVLTHSEADWAADQLFADRAALVACVAKESMAIVADLMDAAGDRWPHPPRR